MDKKVVIVRTQLNDKTVLKYGIAIVFTLAALFLTALLWLFISDNSFIFFIAAVVLSAWRGGLGPGLLTGALSIILADYFLIEPLYVFSTRPHDILQFTVFALLAGLISWLEASRNRSEQALRELKDELEIILQGAADGITAQDARGRVVFANQAASALTGYQSPESMFDMTVTDLRRKFDMLDEHDAPLPDTMLPHYTVFQSGKSHAITYRIRFKDNGEERWIAMRSSPVFDKDGKVRLAVSILRDITRIKQLTLVSQQTETRLRKVLDNLAMFVGVLTPDGILIEANRSALTLANLKLADVQGKPFDQTYWWAYSDEVRQQLRDAVQRAARGAIVRYDVSIRLSENRFIMIDFMLAPVLDDTGQVEYLIPSGIDITERINLTRLLTGQRRRLEAILNSIPGIVYEASDVPDGTERRVDFVSNYAETMLGYSLDEWHASHNFWKEVVHPDDWGYTITQTNINNPDNSSSRPTSFRCITKDGRTLYAEAYTGIITDVTGKQVGMCGVVLDVSEKKKQEVEVIRLTAFIEQQRQRLNTIIANVPGIVYEGSVSLQKGEEWMTFISGYVEKLLGYAPEEWQKNPGFWQTIIHPDDWEPTQQYIKASYQTGTGQKLQFRCMTRDGQMVFLEDHSSVIRDADGEIVGVCGVMMDITDRNRIEQAVVRYTEELRRSNEELEQFAYIASHDLQEPLRMITSYLQLIEQRYGAQLDGDAEEFIHFAVDGAARMKTLIHALLDYSHVQRSPANFAPVQLEEVVQRVLHNLQLVIEDTQAVITHDTLPEITANGAQLEQVLQNLVGNALKFRRAIPPMVHIGVQRQKRYWQFSVSDNGIGIEPDHQARIFVIFQRLHMRDEYPGTGIGLAICKKIVEKHGGQIRFESQLGQGTTFYFTIPIQMPERITTYADN